jgi:hypothetical protein
LCTVLPFLNAPGNYGYPAVIVRLLPAAARVRAQVRPSWICGRKYDSGRSFSPNALVYRAIHYKTATRSLVTIIRAAKTGQTVADVPSEFSLSSPQEIIQKKVYTKLQNKIS